jgi:hypothetical protein
MRVILVGAPLWAFRNHTPTSNYAADATTFLMMAATLRIDPLRLYSFPGLSTQSKSSPRRLQALETHKYDASLWMWSIMSDA